MDVAICQVYWASQLLFSLHFLVWNLLVAVVLVSVARTQVRKGKVSSHQLVELVVHQTISIRKFLRELEQDAILLDRQLHASYGKQVANSQVISSQVPHLTFGSELGVHYPYRRGIFLFTLQALKIEPEHGW